MDRKETVIPRRPCRLSFSFPPTEEELAALNEIRKKRCVTAVFAAGMEDDRLCLLVEWSGTEAAPTALATKPKPRVVGRYNGLKR